MAAGREQRKADPVQVAAEIVAAMEARAASGDWDSVAELAGRLRAAILNVPERDRPQLLLAARQCVQKVQSGAQRARDELADRLAVLRRGREMAAAYIAAE